MSFQTIAAVTDAALADAELRTGLTKEALRVLEASAVMWSDGSIGCPQPDMGYTQALVPGFRVRIEAGAEVLDYHATQRGTLFICPAGRAIPPVPGMRQELI